MSQREIVESKCQVDNVDRQIINQLQENGRRTFGRIAKNVGVSEATVRQRIRRLIESDVMRIVAVPDPLALGVQLRATIGVRADGDLRARRRGCK